MTHKNISLLTVVWMSKVIKTINTSIFVGIVCLKSSIKLIVINLKKAIYSNGY